MRTRTGRCPWVSPMAIQGSPLRGEVNHRTACVALYGMDLTRGVKAVLLGELAEGFKRAGRRARINGFAGAISAFQEIRGAARGYKCGGSVCHHHIAVRARLTSENIKDDAGIGRGVAACNRIRFGPRDADFFGRGVARADHSPGRLRNLGWS